MSGNFTCEVTADAPSFYTATATNFLQVVGEFTALIGSLVHIEIHNETKFKWNSFYYILITNFYVVIFAKGNFYLFIHSFQLILIYFSNGIYFVVLLFAFICWTIYTTQNIYGQMNNVENLF